MENKYSSSFDGFEALKNDGCSQLPPSNPLLEKEWEFISLWESFAPPICYNSITFYLTL